MLQTILQWNLTVLFIGDKLPESQQTFGFQMQSLFVGAGITFANLSLFFFQKLFW